MKFKKEYLKIREEMKKKKFIYQMGYYTVVIVDIEYPYNLEEKKIIDVIQFVIIIELI